MPTATNGLLSLTLLGVPQLILANQSLPLARRQMRALLFRLGVTMRPLARDQLCFLFWPDSRVCSRTVAGARGCCRRRPGTRRLLFGSKAIDSANNAFCTPVDQRNVVRPQGAGCDIGAFEAEP